MRRGPERLVGVPSQITAAVGFDGAGHRESCYEDKIQKKALLVDVR